MPNMVVLWACAVVVFLVIEAATVGLASIWFALGAVCALIAALLSAPPWLQIVWFVLISVASLVLTRKLVKKYVNDRREPTNADRVIGMTCHVTELIDNYSGTGAVAVGGKTWTARSVDNSSLPVGALVTVKDIRGVTLLVSAADFK